MNLVVRKGSQISAAEVKGGRIRVTGGLEEFCGRFKGSRPILVSDANISCGDLLRGGVKLFS